MIRPITYRYRDKTQGEIIKPVSNELNLQWITLNCPYCGEPFETRIDCSSPEQQHTQHYIEDCQICCSPIVFDIKLNWDGTINQIKVSQDNN